QGKLISAGISAFVCDENMHAMNWHMGMALGGIRLQVPDSQMVRALEVLDDFEPEESGEVETEGGDDEDMEEVACCPECESLEVPGMRLPVARSGGVGRICQSASQSELTNSFPKPMARATIGLPSSPCT